MVFQWRYLLSSGVAAHVEQCFHLRGKERLLLGFQVWFWLSPGLKPPKVAMSMDSASKLQPLWSDSHTWKP